MKDYLQPRFPLTLIVIGLASWFLWAKLIDPGIWIASLGIAQGLFTVHALADDKLPDR